MGKIFEAAGDVVDDTIDVVTDNKEIIAAITLAYLSGGTSIPATAEATAAVTAAELTAAEIAAAEAARIAAIETSKQAALAETIAAGKTSGEIALANSSTAAINPNAFVPSSMSALQATPNLGYEVLPNSLRVNPPTNIESVYPDLTDQVERGSKVFNQGVTQPNIFERGLTAVKDAGTAFVNDPIGSTSRAFEEYRPKTPGEYFTTALSLSAGGNLISALNQPKQTGITRSTTNTYSGPQAPKTYVTQPATPPLPVRYDAAKQQVSRTVGTPSSVGLLAVNNSPFYDFLRTNNINRGIL
jgi:hypothetical protein